MEQSVLDSNETITLPSDQDASGRTLGAEELQLLKEVIESGTLTSTKGKFVKTLEERFAEKLGTRYAYACASGTAAIHCAVAALDPEPGDEIITSPITDMGALSPILYQGAIPVFADVDPETYNVTPETVAACLSERTRAIVVTHLFGNPCETEEIVEMARKRDIPVIEDCAQSFLAEQKGKRTGTMGAIGCFSLQQGKHMTTGEGGMVATDDENLARRIFLFINKAWGYGDANPDHYFLALNYRLSELQGAVGCAQLEKLDWVVEQRIRTAHLLTGMLDGIDGIETPLVHEGNTHVYWKYCLRVDSKLIEGGANAVARELKERGIASAPRYIQKPAFMCEVFQKQKTFGTSRFPFTLAREEALDYSPEKFPGSYAALEGVLVLPWNERYTEEHVDYIARAVREAANRLRK